MVDGRTARATTNKTDEESLRRVLAAAISLARNEPENPDLLPMLGPQKYQKVSHFYRSTVAATPQDRARAVARVCKMADAANQTAAGIYTTGFVQTVLANSKGLVARHDHTRAEFSVTILEDNSSGWAKANSADILNIDPERIIRKRQRKSSRLAQTARTGARTLHRDPGTARRARSDRLDFLRFCRHRDSR